MAEVWMGSLYIKQEQQMLVTKCPQSGLPHPNTPRSCDLPAYADGCIESCRGGSLTREGTGGFTGTAPAFRALFQTSMQKSALDPLSLPCVQSLTSHDEDQKLLDWYP